MGNPAVLAAITLAILCGGGYLSLHAAARRRSGLRQRLSAFSAAGIGAETDDTEASLRRRPVGEGRWRFLPSGLLQRLDAVLAAAGHTIGPLHLIATGAIAAGVTTVFAVGVMGLSPLMVIVAAAAAAAAAPVWLVRRAQRRFQQRFLDIFPDALDLIVRAVRAGLPVLDAMGVAAAEIPAPVGNELQAALDQMRVGVDMEVALQQSADRIRVPDFWFFVVSLALQRRTGGALAETLSNLSALIRRRKEVRVRTRALTAESKASTIILGSLPVLVALALYLLSRDSMTSLFADPRGRFLLGLATMLLLAGIMTMAAMVKRIMR